MKDVVRPHRVLAAVRYLTEHSELFRREQIGLIENWDFLKDAQFSNELYKVVDANGNTVQVGNAADSEPFDTGRELEAGLPGVAEQPGYVGEPRSSTRAAAAAAELADFGSPIQLDGEAAASAMFSPVEEAVEDSGIGEQAVLPEPLNRPVSQSFDYTALFRSPVRDSGVAESPAASLQSSVIVEGRSGPFGLEEEADSDEEWTELPEKEGGEEHFVSETMLMPTNMIPDEEAVIRAEQDPTLVRDMCLAVAPAEGSRPLSLYMNNDVLTLAFPDISGGEVLRPPPGMFFGEFSKWLMMHVDSRARLNIQLLFYLTKRNQVRLVAVFSWVVVNRLVHSIQFIQVEASVNQINVATRKGTFKGKNVTELLANKGALLNDCVFKDQAFRILHNLKGSPAYWEWYADV